MKSKVKLQFILRGSSATSLHERLQLYMYIHQFSFNIDYIERQTGWEYLNQKVVPHHKL